MRTRAEQDGSILVEAAIAAPVLLIMFILALNLVLTAYRAASLHYALAKGARFGKTGRQLCPPGEGPSCTQKMSRVSSISYVVWDTGRQFGVDFGMEDFSPSVNPEAINVCPAGQSNCDEENFHAGRGVPFQVSARVPIKFGGLINVTLESQSVAVTESN